ncbi:MAG: type I 3-dehydroquinate dehydratase [Planctomycetota bacterium]
MRESTGGGGATETFGLIGTGAVAHALTRVLVARGEDVVVWGRSAASAAALVREAGEGAVVAATLSELCARVRIAVVAVSDPALGSVAALVAAAAPSGALLRVVHTAGAYSGEEALGPIARAGFPVGSAHPLVAVQRDTASFEGLPFAVEGADGAALELARALGASPLELPEGPTVKLRYHALATMVATGVVALVERAARELGRGGPAEADLRRAYAALARSAAENIGRAPIEEALTGAVARGDDAMLESHERALEHSAALSPYGSAVHEARSLTELDAPRPWWIHGRPLVVSLVPRSFGALEAALHALARTREADVVEVRLEQLTHDPKELEAGLQPLFAAHGGPILCAVHGAEAFGDFAGPAPERLALLAAAARAGATAVDVDALFASSTSSVDVPRILSTHAAGPDAESLEAAYGRALGHARACDLVKVIPACATAEEGFAVLRWLERRRPERAVVFGSGAAAVFTRLLAPRFGSSLVYVRPSAAVEAAVAAAGHEPLVRAAPGQPPADEVRAVWAAARDHDALDVAAVLGRPIEHSASPAIHGAACAELGLDGVLVPIAPDGLGQALDLPHLRGASVTAPFKSDAARAAARTSEAVDAIGAANTLFRTDDVDGWQAANTDVDGIVAALVGAGARLEAGTTAVVVGAGGAARAAVWALASRGVAVTVAARSEERAQALAAHFGPRLGADGGTVVGVRLDALGDGFARPDVLVHTTPLGTGGRGRAPVPDALLGPGVRVLDAVYDPARTELLRRAARAGAVPISGGAWFLGQAWAQFGLIFGAQLEGLAAEERRARSRPERLEQARAAMARAFGERLSRAAGGRDRAPILCLVGLRGAGKSTLGALGAERAGLPFRDLDAEAARAAGFPDAGAFIEDRGLAAFREAEAAALREALSATDPRVVACGGGVVEDPRNRALLRRAWVVWLDVDLDVARARVAADATRDDRPVRPALAEGDEFAVLAARRAPWFEEVASRRIELDARDQGREGELGAEILLGWRHAPPSDWSAGVLSSD